MKSPGGFLSSKRLRGLDDRSCLSEATDQLQEVPVPQPAYNGSAFDFAKLPLPPSEFPDPEQKSHSPDSVTHRHLNKEFTHNIVQDAKALNQSFSDHESDGADAEDERIHQRMHSQDPETKSTSQNLHIPKNDQHNLKLATPPLDDLEQAPPLDDVQIRQVIKEIEKQKENDKYVLSNAEEQVKYNRFSKD